MTNNFELILYIQPPKRVRNLIMGPEDRLTGDIISYLADMVINEEINAKFFHVPNEGKRSRLVAHKMKVMGMYPGVSDIILQWNGGSAELEVKTEKGRLTDNQKMNMYWCDRAGVPHFVVRSIEDVESALQSLGLLRRE